jgi:hypothetical protein
VTDREMLDAIFASVPREADRVIIIYPSVPGESACRWFGMSAEGVAETLYQVADSIVDQRIPMKARP